MIPNDLKHIFEKSEFLSPFDTDTRWTPELRTPSKDLPADLQAFVLLFKPKNTSALRVISSFRRTLLSIGAGPPS